MFLNSISMKRPIFTLILLALITLTGQAQKEIAGPFFDHMMNEARILTKDGPIKGKENIRKFASGFSSTHGENISYKKHFSIEVNAMLDYETGEIQTESGLFHVMFLKRKEHPEGAKIEFLVIYKGGSPANDASAIEARRNEWMALCNEHKAGELVKELYTANAYYYNRGRLLQGTKALSAEYGYMNAESYSLKLTPKHVEFVSADIAYEIGRCSGSYPYPYMLLWQKQADGKWKILMDSNY